MVATPTAAVAALALVGGAAAGVGLERADLFSPLAEPEPAVVLADRVPVLDCPDGTLVAGLTRGDRVLATGRSDDGAWIEIRSPVNLDQPAWLAAGALQGDRSLDDLPVHECERTGPTTTSTTGITTTTSSTSTTSTVPESTTTTEPPPPTTTSSTTTTSLPETTTTTTIAPPDARSAEIDPVIVAARNDEPGFCGNAFRQPESGTLTAEVTGASRVTFSLDLDGTSLGSGELRLLAGSTFTAQVGPFDEKQFASGRGEIIGQVTVTVTATGPGGQDQVQTFFDLMDCG